MPGRIMDSHRKRVVAHGPADDRYGVWLSGGVVDGEPNVGSAGGYGDHRGRGVHRKPIRSNSSGLHEL